MSVKHHIESLISQGEHQQLEFKFRIDDARKIARTMSAFANTDGGIILIGVKDNGNIAGVRQEEELYMVEAAAKMYTRPNIEFICKQHVLNKKIILEIIIKKGLNKPYLAIDEKNSLKAYFRNKDETLLANKIMINVWKNQHSEKDIKIKFDKSIQILFDKLNKNKTISLMQFVRYANIHPGKAEHILVKLLLLHILKFHFAETKILYQFDERYENKATKEFEQFDFFEY